MASTRSIAARAVAKAARSSASKPSRPKRSGQSACAKLKAEEDREAAKLAKIRERREALEKANEGKRKEAADKLEKKQKGEQDALAKKHAKEQEQLTKRFGCTPKPPRRRKKGSHKKKDTAATDVPVLVVPSSAVAPPPAPAPRLKPPPAPAPRPKRSAPVITPSSAPARPRTTRPRSTSTTPRAALLALPPYPHQHGLAAVVELGAIRRAVGLVRKAHVPSGVTSGEWDTVTLYTSGPSLLLHSRMNRGEIVVAIPAEVRQAGVVHVEIAKLNAKLLAGEGKIPVTLEGGEGSEPLRVHLGSASGFWATRNDPEPPASRGVEAAREADVEPANLRRALEAVLYAVSRDEARVNLNSVFVGKADGHSRFISTDGHRMVIHEDAVPYVLQRGHVLLDYPEARLLPELLGLSTAARLAGTVGDETLVVAGAGPALAWMLVLPSVNVTFPPYEQVVPKGFTHVCSAPAAELREALRPIAGPKAERLPSARATYSGAELTIIRTDIGGEGVSASVPLRCMTRDPVVFGVNPRYFLDAVSHGPIANADEVGLSIIVSKGDVLDPLKIAAAGDGWATTAVVMPMRT